MPVELAERPTPQLETKEPQLKIKVLDRETILGKTIDDEFNNTDITPLEPFQGNYPDDPEYEKYLGEALKKDFIYYSRTRKLELGTERTKVLQDILDQMTEGTNVKTRAVIMNKGEDAAFVTPDGTVFTSQSMLNQLSTTDGIAAVLAHEVGHLILRTSQKGGQTKYGFGVGWVHEAACDTIIAPPLLEKTGFNSLAFAGAIQKISGFERGTIHQSGLARASESVGTHLLIDRVTSAQDEVPISPLLKKDWQPGNLDHVMKMVDNVLKKFYPSSLFTDLKESIERLHPQDLSVVYIHLEGRGIILLDKESKGDPSEIFKLCNEIISSRLRAQNYTDDEIKFFLLEIGSPIEVLSFNKKDLKIISDILVETQTGDTKMLRRMHQTIFDSDRLEGVYHPTSKFLTKLERHLYDENYESQKYGMPCDRDSLLDALERISHIEFLAWEKDDITISITKVIQSYIYRTYFKFQDKEGLVFDIEYVKEFFESIKSRGILLDSEFLVRRLKNANERYYRFEIGKVPQKENREAVISAIEEVYGGFVLSDENINRIVSTLSSHEITPDAKAIFFGKFLSDAKFYLDDRKIPDGERLRFLRHFVERLKESEFSFNVPLVHLLEKGREGPYQHDYKTLDKEITLFNLSIAAARTFLTEDNDLFYDFVSETTRRISPYLNNFSKVQLINLANSLFAAKNFFLLDSDGKLVYGTISAVQINNFDQFCNLEIVRRILALEDNFKIDNIHDLNEEAKKVYSKLFANISSDIYSDRPISLILGKPFREAFNSILQKGIEDEQLEDLYNFVNGFYTGGEKPRILREINLRYIRSNKFPFDTRLDYAIKYFDNVGLEALIILAEEIEDIESYKIFRQKAEDQLSSYFEGQIFTQKIAVGDFLTSKLVDHFDQLLETAKTDPKTKTKLSTELSVKWFQTLLEGKEELTNMQYDHQSKRFILGEKERRIFTTIKDTFLRMKGLSPLERGVLVHKSLTDKDGGLTKDPQRRKLARLTVDSLGFRGGFIAATLREACLHADSKLVALPLSQILAPLIFRAFDTNSVNIDKVLKSKAYPLDKYRLPDRKLGDFTVGNVLSQEDLIHFINSDTRSVSQFGAAFFGYPDSPFWQMSQQSDNQFVEIQARLKELFPDSLVQKDAQRLGVSESVEAVIKGVERSGALGVRSLQLAAQFYPFEGELGKRLSESLDSQPGLNKLLFWENLHKLSGEDEQIRDFISRMKLSNYIGGGSLQTTFVATLIQEDGTARPVVVKMKNPNIEAFIKDSYKSATDVLEHVRGLGMGANAHYARIGLSLIDLAQKWCLDDINDKTFIEDDELFVSRVSALNQKEGKEIFYIPEKVFTTSKVKSEDLARGKTVNKFLSDESVPEEQKRQVVEILSRFFSLQFSGQPYRGEDGKQFYLIHSDPHIGNYIVDAQNGEFKIGVIDRSMYLKVSPEDTKALEGLIQRGNDNAFVYNFVDRVLDINKVRGLDRRIKTAQILNAVYGEYVKQRVTGRIDRLSLMISMLSSIDGLKLDVPLHLRLMIRNIGAFQELGRRYGVDFEQLYKEAI